MVDDYAVYKAMFGHGILNSVVLHMRGENFLFCMEPVNVR
jgi:hypothetical protein